ncbi:MAG: hypothetical protein Q9165_003267 [Trypethelium subeluteriae]
MSVRVVARVRPLLKLEQDKDVIVTTSGSGEESPASPTVVRIPNPKNEAESFSFQFNSVYDQESTQQSIFENEGLSPTVKHLFNGFDVTIFAYGVTGTGKTHTMRGGKSLAERGVIPRLLSSIYRRTRKIEKDSAGETRAEVSMSYYEIYNDRVHDLFESPEKRSPSGLPIRDNNGKTVVVGLTERPCTTLKEFEQLYDRANVNRSTSATKVKKNFRDDKLDVADTKISTASAIDLAGSEDNRRTDNGKERMVESASINKSLFVLAQCVEAISKKQTRVPYRESKMTRILSLGQNNGLTVMILNLAPVRSYQLDTLSSLNFANRTKKIEVNEIENEPIFNYGQAARQTSTVLGSSIQQRQPLRPLAVSHNVQSTKTDKPVKAFSVYSDKARTVRPLATIANTSRKLESSKQALSESHLQTTMHPDRAMRPSNIARPPLPGNPMLSKANIEALIDRRIEEQLAVQRHQDSAAPTKHIDEEFQKRLEKLERRIEEKEEMDDPKAEGLQYLLMAKQHTASGHDQSALKMYQLALPFFPQNRKLAHKIQKLEDKIKVRKAAHISPPQMTSESSVPTPIDAVPTTSESERAIIQKATRPTTCDDPDDDDYHGEPPKRAEYDSDSDATLNAPPKSRKPVSKAKLPVFRDLSAASDEQPTSPRTSTLLQIINTRDLKQIRSLKGVGAKRAAAIVDALCEMDTGAGAEEALTTSTITSLEQLEALKGVGRSTVEGMRMGLAS